MHTSQLGVPPFKSIPRTLNTLQEKQTFRMAFSRNSSSLWVGEPPTKSTFFSDVWRGSSMKFFDFMGGGAPHNISIFQ